MTDLSDPRLLWLKALLFVVCGMFAVVALLLAHPTFAAAMLVALAIWSFCRAYYFAFYVVEHYIDPSYRFSGLLSVLRYAADVYLRKEKPEG